MSRFGFVFASSLLVASAALGACSNAADDCQNTGTCDPVGGSSAAGTATGGKGGSQVGGNTSSGGSTAGDGGNDAGGSFAGGKGGSMAAAGEAGAGAGGGGVTLPCDGACAAPKPVCDEPTDTCVECLEEGDCAGGAKKKCDTTAKTCVECLASTECASAAAAKCDGGACVKCTSNDDCAHVAGKGVCDGGTCVQCTVADETACAGKSCNPAAKACTTTPVGSVGSCEPCLADSECSGGNLADPNARCVPMEFKGAKRNGGFCLRRVVKTCTKPFQTPLNATSLSGATAENYCGINQDDVRCEAVLDLVGGAECPDNMDTSCGCIRDKDGNCTGTGAGGLCRTVGVNASRCTYGCATTADCPGSLKCTIDDPYCH